MHLKDIFMVLCGTIFRCHMYLWADWHISLWLTQLILQFIVPDIVKFFLVHLLMQKVICGLSTKCTFLFYFIRHAAQITSLNIRPLFYDRKNFPFISCSALVPVTHYLAHSLNAQQQWPRIWPPFIHYA